MMNFITSKCRLLNLNNDYTDVNTLNSMMRQRIENLQNNPDLAGDFSITVMNIDKIIFKQKFK